MSRPQTSWCRKYFKYLKAANRNNCQLCGKEIKGDHAGNLLKHLQAFHKDIYQENIASHTHNTKTIPKTIANSTLNKFIIPERRYITNVKLTSDEIKSACLEMVTKNGRPFSILTDSGFRKILNPILDGANTNTNKKLKISIKNIKMHMNEVAEAVKSKLKAELCERLVSIKIDSATRLKRSVLGINAQFIENGKIIIRTLAMLELKEKHTGDYIANEVQAVLKLYGMDLANIYTATSDNGANMLKAVKILGDRLIINENVLEDDSALENKSDEYEKLTDSEDSEDEQKTSDHTRDEILEETINGLRNSQLTGTSNNFKIISVRCASHTLQLAITDSLKGEEKHLSHIRSLVKKLRTPSGILFLKQQKLLIPPLDCITRWSSTFRMLDTIINNQVAYDNIAISIGVKIQPNNWIKAKEIRDALNPAARSTVKFQAEQLVMSDVYKEWIKCKLATAKLSSEFAKVLLKNLNFREPNILNTLVMKSAIFLDPRFQSVLTSSDRIEAKSHLKDIWNRIESVPGQPEGVIDAVLDVQNISSLNNSTTSDEELENHLRDISAYLPPAVNQQKLNILSKLEAFDNIPIISRKFSILDYWDLQKMDHPELYALSKVVFGVPATQVSVESHVTRTASWLPPTDSWKNNEELPYGWEKALDQKGRPYYINHINKTTTYEAPDCYKYDEHPPEPRVVILQRSPTMGFGFVAGSERPVIVRFVTEGGPSVNKLEPGDQILAVNGEDVKDAPRDHVIQLVRACDSQVSLLVCQPMLNCGGVAGRKSTLLSATKKAKLRSRPSRVRFAESVCVNGAPLFPPSAFSLGDICVPPMANVLKVFLENGQTKSFKYDATTTVQDVVTSLRDKLCLTASEHFSLVLEHVKTLKRNKLTLLDPQETLARIASRPGAHKLRCLFRVTFVPVSAANLAQKDLNSLDYLYMQCCNDVVQERFAPELLPDVALRLAALQMHQHALANNMSPTKLTVKTVEEFGLERFVPASLIEGMKRKELRRLISHFLKLNAQMTGSSTKTLTQLQAKIHYLDIVSGLPSYGAKCFSTNSRSNVESVLLISPRFGFSQISDVTKTVPKSISAIEDVHRVVAVREDDIFYSVSIYIQPDRVVTFSMEDRDASEFALVLAGYYKLLTGKDLLVDKEREIYVEDYAPPYLSLHSVIPSNWSYLPSAQIRAHCMAFSMPPPYHSTKKLSFDYQNADRNMNTTMNNKNHKNTVDNNIMISGGGGGGHGMDEFGFDIHSVLSMEILEGAVGNIGKDGSLSRNGLIEARNEEVLKRVAEMQKMIENSERYLNEQGELMDEYEHTTQNQSALRQPWQSSLTHNTDRDSDCDSLASSKVSSNEDAPPPGVLKHSDSLILLAESINHDLSGITKGLNSISSNLTQNDSSLSPITSQQNTPKVVRKSHGLSQILNELQTLGNDLSQSESDSESISTPNNSPIRLRNTQQDHNSSKGIRTSFGLHSPDSPALGCDTKDNNLKEYLRQLREASNNEESTDLAALKLKELYGIDLTDDTIIETDADLIDLRAFPPPQTPDELDALTVLDAPPSGFGDLDPKLKNHHSMNLGTEPNLEEFLAKVIIAPPGQKLTPCKELTPEEIMSFIIPPPPGLNDPNDHQGVKSAVLNRNVNKNIKETEPNVPKNYDKNLDKIKNKLLENNNTNFNNNLMKFNNKNINNNNSNINNNTNNKEESLYINSINFHQPQYSSPLKQQPKSILTGNAATNTVPIAPTKSNHVIEYPTIERKGGPFSCCTKSKKEGSPPESPVRSTSETITTTEQPLELPPRNQQNAVVNKPPIRPPKNPELQYRVNSLPRHKLNGNLIPSYYEMAGEPPQLPPRYLESENNKPIITTPPVMSSPPPKKPPLPPVPIKPILKSPIPILKHNLNSPEMLYNGSNSGGGSGNSSPVRVAGIGSPHFHRNLNSYRKIDRAFNQTATDMSIGIVDHINNPSQIGPIPAPRTNGHYRSLSDCPPVCLQNPSADKKPQLSLLCSPQMSRKLSSGSCSGSSNSTTNSLPSSPQLSNRNGHVLNAETLLTKTTIAMDGLLVKLDQVAANCSAAQSAGGGNCIDEQQYQIARDNLTEYGLQLVSSSKLLVVSLSDGALIGLPENLTACLTAFRSITELAKDLSKFTSTPLQTRNIVLKVHDVASSFRELVSCKIGPLGAGQLALQAECLANALASLLRSLRVFSP